MDASSRIGLIIQGTPETLQQARALLLQDRPQNEITVELPLIDGFAVELDAGSLDLLPRLSALGDIHVSPDLEVSLPPQEPAPPGAQLDLAKQTLNVQPVWDQGYLGRGVGIAIVDTGIARHPDLRDRIVAFKDCINDRTETYDDHGHGSHVAGIAAGDGNSGGRYKGIAPEANLIGIKVLNDKGRGKSSEIIDGIQWAVENRSRYNIKAMNISIGGKAWIGEGWDPMARAASKAMEKGIFVAVAAGNSGPDAKTIESPGIAEAVCTVANLNQRWSSDRADDEIAESSSRGPTFWNAHVKPDVAAPGTWITSCDRAEGYTSMSGTSMASPMVAGAAALLMQAKPSLTGPEVKRVLMNTAAPLQGADALTQGRGMIDPPRALAAVKP
jgi:serine protease AprX